MTVSAESVVTPRSEPARPWPVLVAGAPPGIGAGNPVSTSVMLSALRSFGRVGILTHRASPLPRLVRAEVDGATRLELGSQPLALHAETLVAGHVHRGLLREWAFAWVINSRYASAVAAAGVPYAIWEATTIRDELRVTDRRADRRAGRGSGIGNLLHRTLLPLDERLEGRLYRNACAVFAMSRYTAECIEAIHGAHAPRVELLPHPPSPEYLEALALERRSTAAREPDGEARLLFVGRADDPRKNIDLLLDALARLRAAGERASLTIVGPHGERWARSLAAHPAAEAVRLRGRVSTRELAAAYLSHDLFVLPSRQEGFGIVVAEALHAGLPVVATRCGGPEDVLRESGAGRLIEATVTALTDAVRATLANRDEYAAMRARGLAYAGRELSLERFVARVQSVTTACLVGSGR